MPEASKASISRFFSGLLGSHVPYKSLIELRAAYMPDVAWAVSGISQADLGGRVSDMVTRKKPAPDIYELLLTMLRISAPAAVAFEDSANGLMAAKAAGLYTIVTPSSWTTGQKFESADLVLSSLGDPDMPLDSASAAEIGAPYLELANLKTMRSVAAEAVKLSDAGSWLFLGASEGVQRSTIGRADYRREPSQSSLGTRSSDDKVSVRFSSWAQQSVAACPSRRHDIALADRIVGAPAS
jgi:Haloacid dehalogenase-like hydrolase